MSKTYLARSADVLSEADRMQAIMDWQLFTYEQETALWGFAGPVVWVPGDPIYIHPNYDYERTSGAQHVRWMIEEFEDGEHYQEMLCKRCDVSWSGSTRECWMCGKSLPALPTLKLNTAVRVEFLGLEPITDSTQGLWWAEVDYFIDYDVYRLYLP